MKNIPVVAIVGRPNVGKSALFNRMTKKQISLVYDRAGVTRDRVVADCRWRNFDFTLMDTGGIGLDDESGFEKAIQTEVEIATQAASDILLVVDGREGLQNLDEDVARRLRKSKKKVLVVVNKIDSIKQENFESEFSKLGEVFPISAAHGIGVDDLMERLSEGWKESFSEEKKEEDEEIKKEDVKKTRAIRVAIVGKPNVGKSSLINALVNESRLIVSPIAGTTRDAVDIHFQYKNKEYCFVDTAGMRKRNRIEDPLEAMMTGRTAHTINRSDICVLVMNALEGVGEQEKKIAGLIQKAEKPCILLVNKWDLAAEQQKKNLEAFRHQYESAVRKSLFFIPYAAVVFTSALEGKNLNQWLQELERVEKERNTQISTGILNRILQRAAQRVSPSRKGHRTFKIYYATQKTDDVDVPTIVTFVNDPKLLTGDYQRYLEQKIRSDYPCRGCPIKWIFKKHHRDSSK